MANNIAKYNEAEVDVDIDDKNFVKVPIEVINENKEIVREFKTYKILKRLDFQ